jgi:hypothetical protein
MIRTFHNSARSIATGMAAVLFAASPFIASLAHAQQRHDGREHARERFQTPHWVLDNRFHHNHYYPSAGYSMSVLPAGHIAVTFRGGRFFLHSGVWFQVAGPGYVVVRPPVGIVVPVLPPAYTTVWGNGVPYYYANDVYYVERPGGYAVAAPPIEPNAGPTQTPPPPAPAPALPAVPAPGVSAPALAPSASANWYYCESSKGYYPYVSECREAWRVVPATPPQAR